MNKNVIETIGEKEVTEIVQKEVEKIVVREIAKLKDWLSYEIKKVHAEILSVDSIVKTKH